PEQRLHMRQRLCTLRQNHLHQVFAEWQNVLRERSPWATDVSCLEAAVPQVPDRLYSVPHYSLTWAKSNRPRPFGRLLRWENALPLQEYIASEANHQSQEPNQV